MCRCCRCRCRCRCRSGVEWVVLPDWEWASWNPSYSPWIGVVVDVEMVPSQPPNHHHHQPRTWLWLRTTTPMHKRHFFERSSSFVCFRSFLANFLISNTASLVQIVTTWTQNFEDQSKDLFFSRKQNECRLLARAQQQKMPNKMPNKKQMPNKMQNFLLPRATIYLTQSDTHIIPKKHKKSIFFFYQLFYFKIVLCSLWNCGKSGNSRFSTYNSRK